MIPSSFWNDYPFGPEAAVACLCLPERIARIVLVRELMFDRMWPDRFGRLEGEEEEESHQRSVYHYVDSRPKYQLTLLR